MKPHDPVNHPSHYTSSPARCECGRGIECIQITEHMGFNLGNAVKYCWRCDLKVDAIQDLEKAVWYIQREIDRRKRILAQSLAKGPGTFVMHDIRICTTAELVAERAAERAAGLVLET